MWRRDVTIMKFLSNIRTPERRVPFQQAIIHTMLIACVGLILGVIVKILDIYTTNLGNVFSQMSIWIFLCTMISIYSSTPKRAAINVFAFCGGMLLTYYATAELTSSVYSMVFIYGWIVVSLVSPLLAIIVWYAKGNGWIARTLAAGILIITLVIAFIMFDKIRISDLLIIAVMAFLHLKK